MECIFLPTSLKEALLERYPDIGSIDMETIIGNFTYSDLNIIGHETDILIAKVKYRAPYLLTNSELSAIVGRRFNELSAEELHSQEERNSLDVYVTKDNKLIVYTCERVNPDFHAAVLEALAAKMPIGEFIKSSPFVAKF